MSSSTNAPATTNTTSVAPSGDAPISPVARQASFPHHTTNAAPIKPFISTDTPSINSIPIELDSTPSTAGIDGTKDTKRRLHADVSPEDEGVEEFGGVEGPNSGREKRAALLNERSKDPAVLVDIPQDPAPEELEKATVRKAKELGL